MKARTIRRLLDGGIALLLALLVFLTVQTWFVNPALFNASGLRWLGQLTGGNPAEQRAFIDLPAILSYSDAMQPTAVVLSSAGRHTGARFGESAVEEMYNAARPAISRAFASMGAVTAIGEDEFRVLLNNAIVFHYPSELPLSLLCSWLNKEAMTEPQATTDMLVCARAEDGTIVLAWQELGVWRQAATQEPYQFADSYLLLRACSFAFEAFPDGGFAPYDLIFSREPSPNRWTMSLSADYAEWGRELLKQFGVALDDAVTYVNSDGELVMHDRDNVHSMTVNPDGTAVYQRLDDAEARVEEAHRYSGTAARVDWAWQLLSCGRPYWGQAAVSLAAVEERGDGLFVQFEYLLSGLPLFLMPDYRSLPAAYMLFDGEVLVSATFCLRMFTMGEVVSMTGERLALDAFDARDGEVLAIYQLFDASWVSSPDWCLMPEVHP